MFTSFCLNLELKRAYKCSEIAKEAFRLALNGVRVFCKQHKIPYFLKAVRGLSAFI